MGRKDSPELREFIQTASKDVEFLTPKQIE
jgi:hypothetical protein